MTSHVPPGNLCDPACQKLLLNGRFMAPIADLLAETVGKSSPLYKPARLLAIASRAHVESWQALAERGIVKETEEKASWEGCPEATQLMKWHESISVGRPVPATAIGKMEQWTAEANKLTLALVSGERPG